MSTVVGNSKVPILRHFLSIVSLSIRILDNLMAKAVCSRGNRSRNEDEVDRLAFEEFNRSTESLDRDPSILLRTVIKLRSVSTLN